LVWSRDSRYRVDMSKMSGVLSVDNEQKSRKTSSW
jgi:hypothetical protein